MNNFDNSSVSTKRIQSQLNKCKSIIFDLNYEIDCIDIEIYHINKYDNIDEYVQKLQDIIIKRLTLLDNRKSIELEIQTYEFQLNKVTKVSNETI